MVALMLLLTVTTLYAGYNLLIKIAGGYVPVEATTTIFATICLQLAARSIVIVMLAPEMTVEAPALPMVRMSPP